jgi:hypothetical protein
VAKLTPVQRWRRYVLERFTALKLSGDLEPLRAEGLAILGRQHLLTGEEWSQPDYRKLRVSEKYQDWLRKCQAVATRFGLAPWTVEMACLLKDYSPETDPFVMESSWPKTSVVTENNDELFLNWLCHEASNLGLYVVLRQGSSETTIIYGEPMSPPEPLSASSRPPRDTVFQLRVETPPNYPPEAAGALQKTASNLGRELLRRLGYPSPRRLRTSILVTSAQKLRANKKRLTEEESAAVIDELNPDTDNLIEDRKLHRRIRSQKYLVRKRLVKPYEPKP